MIDLAIIASIPHLHDLSSMGSIDMALTHLVLDSPDYAAYFRARSEAGVRVLLDNSAYELEHETGQGLSAAPVLAAAEQIAANVIICQDVLYDGPATIAATRRFLNEAAGAPFQFMAVPQGTDRSEWLHCYHHLATTAGIDMIGLSKLSVPRSFAAPVAEARLKCVAALMAENDTAKPLHLLGGDRSLPWELSEHLRLGHDQLVCSNDSSYAFWYPACDISVTNGRAAREAPGKPDLTGRTLTPNVLQRAVQYAHLLRANAGLPAAVDAEAIR